jgi:hypothetical protein
VDWRTWNWEATSQQAVDEITQCLRRNSGRALRRGVSCYILCLPRAI